jgi:hypothetical protein
LVRGFKPLKFTLEARNGSFAEDLDKWGFKGHAFCSGLLSKLNENNNNKEMSVHEVLREIREKTKVGAEDHGLYDPGLERGRAPAWLKETQSLTAQGLVNNVSQKQISKLTI